MNDLISVIVPVYNAEKYIDECVFSIINQKYRNLEIILIDDGSEDSSGKICDKFLKKDIRIKVIHNMMSEGLAEAKNTALEQAKGEFVAFVEATDYINSEFIKDLYHACIYGQCDVAQCLYQPVSEENSLSKLSDEEKQRIYEQDLANVDDGETGDDSEFYINDYDHSKDVYNEMFLFEGKDMVKNLYNERAIESKNYWTKLYRKRLFDAKSEYIRNGINYCGTGIKFPKGRLYEEEAVCFRIFYEATMVICLDKPLYYHRDIFTSQKTRKFTYKDMDILASLEERIQFFLYNNEKELYYLTLRQYFYDIIDARDNCRRYIEKSEKMQRKLNRKARRIMWKLIFTGNFCDMTKFENAKVKMGFMKKLWFYTISDLKN